MSILPSMARINFEVPDDYHTELKVMAAKVGDKSIKGFILEAVKHYKKHLAKKN
jgi:hypothetical protein